MDAVFTPPGRLLPQFERGSGKSSLRNVLETARLRKAGSLRRERGATLQSSIFNSGSTACDQSEAEQSDASLGRARRAHRSIGRRRTPASVKAATLLKEAGLSYSCVTQPGRPGAAATADCLPAPEDFSEIEKEAIISRAKQIGAATTSELPRLDGLESDSEGSDADDEGLDRIRAEARNAFAAAKVPQAAPPSADMMKPRWSRHQQLQKRKRESLGKAIERSLAMGFDSGAASDGEAKRRVGRSLRSTRRAQSARLPRVQFSDGHCCLDRGEMSAPLTSVRESCEESVGQVQDEPVVRRASTSTTLPAVLAAAPVVPHMRRYPVEVTQSRGRRYHSKK